MLERGIRVTRLEGQPDLMPQPYVRSEEARPAKRFDKPARSEERRADWKPKGEFDKKPPFDKKPRFEKRTDGDKPAGAAAKPHWKDREDGANKPAKPPFAGAKPYKGKRDEKSGKPPEGGPRKPKAFKPERS